MRPKTFPDLRLSFAALLCAGLALAAQAAEDVNRIVLRVNDEILTLRDYEQRKAEAINTLLTGQLGSDEQQERLQQIGREIMQQAFREMLLMSRAEQLAVRISETDIDTSLDELMDSQGIPSRAALRQALDQAGMTYERLRENMRRDLVWSRVIGDEVTRNIEIGEEELRAYYRNHLDEFELPESRWLKEVIVLDSGVPEVTERVRIANELRAALVTAASAEEAIEPYETAGQTTSLIDLDWLQRSDVEPALAEQAWNTPAGEYAEPVAARGGYHIVYVAGIKETQVRPFEEVAEALFNRERQRRFGRELQAYLSRLEQAAYVKEDLPPDAVGFRTVATDYEPEEEFDFFGAPATAEGAESAGDDLSGTAPVDG